MKQWFSIILFFSILPISIPAIAQPVNQRIEALKIEFISRKLDLSPDEAEKFWPIYNNYQKEMNQLFRERRALRMRQRNHDGPPPDELNFESRILDIKKRYQAQFQDVLPATKVTLLYQAEREFRERLINQLRQRRQEESH